MKPFAFLLMLALYSTSFMPGGASAASTDAVSIRPAGEPSAQVLIAEGEDDGSCTGDDCPEDIMMEGE